MYANSLFIYIYGFSIIQSRDDSLGLVNAYDNAVNH